MAILESTTACAAAHNATAGQSITSTRSSPTSHVTFRRSYGYATNVFKAHPYSAGEMEAGSFNIILFYYYCYF
jgi:hypothetical protein